MRDRDGTALVYCEGAYGTPNGKTAHGLVRYTERYEVLAVIDSGWAGHDAGQVLDGRSRDIPIVACLTDGLRLAGETGRPTTHMVVGLAPDGGRLPGWARGDMLAALEAGLNVDSGLHDLLSEDPQLAAVAAGRGVVIRDVRKTPPRDQLHGFTGCIREVGCRRVAVLGTDSAAGKRTTAVELVRALRRAGRTAELIGTGQTSWMQGVRYGIVLDALINDFVSGEIEHAIWSAWSERAPETLVLEGQGSLLNPAYPGGFELLAAGRPHAVILQHVPARKDYDGFPGFPIEPIEIQIQAVELIGRCPVAAITISHEGLEPAAWAEARTDLAERTGLPVVDVLREGADRLVAIVQGIAPEAVAGPVG
jgi:uncharacterized NAD-dependent epimerase/dehydratase family protein